MQLTPFYNIIRNSHVIKKPNQKLTDEQKVAIIKRVVSLFTNISIQIMESKNRKREVVEPRQIAMTLIKLNTRLSLKSIGKEFGNRDHATVISAKSKVFDLCDTEKNFKQDFDTLSSMIKKELA